MKPFGLKFFVLLFFVLTFACVFDEPHVGGATSADFGHGGSFCGVMHISAELAIRPSDPALQAYSDEAFQPSPDSLATWSLANAIDHPPRTVAPSL